MSKVCQLRRFVLVLSKCDDIAKLKILNLSFTFQACQCSYIQRKRSCVQKRNWRDSFKLEELQHHFPWLFFLFKCFWNKDVCRSSIFGSDEVNWNIESFVWVVLVHINPSKTERLQQNWGIVLYCMVDTSSTLEGGKSFVRQTLRFVFFSLLFETFFLVTANWGRGRPQICFLPERLRQTAPQATSQYIDMSSEINGWKNRTKS